MIRVITQANLSRLAQVTPAAMSKRAATILKNTRILRGGKSIGLNVDAPLVVEWLATHDVYHVDDKLCRIILNKKESLAEAKKNKNNGGGQPVEVIQTPAPAPTPTKRGKKKANGIIKLEPGHTPAEPQKPASIGGYPLDQLESMTVKQVVEKFGSIDGFKRFVDTLRSISEYNLREIKIQERRGELVSVEFISRAVYQLIDQTYKRLIDDVPRSISSQVLAVAETGGDNMLSEIEKIYLDATTTILKNTKKAILSKNILKENKN